jgi:hypothetical protein
MQFCCYPWHWLYFQFIWGRPSNVWIGNFGWENYPYFLSWNLKWMKTPGFAKLNHTIRSSKELCYCTDRDNNDETKWASPASEASEDYLLSSITPWELNSGTNYKSCFSYLVGEPLSWSKGYLFLSSHARIPFSDSVSSSSFFSLTEFSMKPK